MRHFDHVIDVHVILSVVKLQHHAEVTLHTRGKDIYVEADDANMYASIDALIDKLDRSVLKHKSRLYEKPHESLKRSDADL